MRELTAAQAAELLNLSPDRVRKLAQSGRLPGEKVGGSWFFKPEDVAAFKARPRLPGYPKGKPRRII
jgi:excisionase family DNA binding protein